MITIIEKEKFYHDGRGPELIKINYNDSGVVINSIDYRNPDSESLQNISFVKSQAFMITPEEEYDYNSVSEYLKNDKGALFNLNKSEWYKSFTNRHSHNCNHYKMVFYDEIIDLLCEDVLIQDSLLKRNKE